jgi:hypothetical protein
VGAPPGPEDLNGDQPAVEDPRRRDGRRGIEDSGAIRRRSLEDSGAIRRRSLEDSGAIRRRSLEDSGAIRRRLPEESGGRSGRDRPSSAAKRASARTSATMSARRASRADGADSSRSWLTTLLIVVAVVVLALVALGGYLLINSGQSNPPAKRSASGAGVKARDISSRDVDQTPMTEKELFPSPQIVVGSASYQVLKTQAADCQSAASDDLAKLLGDLDCSQVVRGTLRSPDSQFLITAGIFNLKDEASANKAYETIKPTLDTQKGRFSGLAAGDGTEAIVRAPTTLGWHPLGHFLAYCIVAHADSKPIAADDPASKQVISDVVEGYLRDGVLGARAAGPPSAAK